MTIYYFELENDFRPANGERRFDREFQCESDEEARQVLQAKYGTDLLCIYKESDTANGEPFVMVYERDSK